MRTLPERVTRRIAEAWENDEIVVVVPRAGKSGRVYRLDKYLKLKNLPKRVRPWAARRDRRPRRPDPLGSVEGRVAGRLRRRDIYE